MFNTTVTELGEMTYKENGFEELVNGKEVCINVDFQKIVGVQRDLPNYYVSVTIHSDGEKSVLVYENGKNTDDLPIGFTDETQEELIKFAEKHPKYSNIN